jgi:hypothetical protein
MFKSYSSFRAEERELTSRLVFHLGLSKPKSLLKWQSINQSIRVGPQSFLRLMIRTYFADSFKARTF